MGDHEDAAKERRRVDKIFNTVYKHARSHGQSHRSALKYCLNVFSDQAPSWSRKIVIQAIKAESPMKIDRLKLRKMISEALVKEGIIDYVPRPTPTKRYEGEGEVIEPKFGGMSSSDKTSFVDALEGIKTQIEDLTVTMTNITHAQEAFLNSIIDILNDGIADEEVVDGTLPDFMEDTDDVYDEDEEEIARYLRHMGEKTRMYAGGRSAALDPIDDED